MLFFRGHIEVDESIVRREHFVVWSFIVLFSLDVDAVDEKRGSGKATSGWSRSLKINPNKEILRQYWYSLYLFCATGYWSGQGYIFSNNYVPGFRSDYILLEVEIIKYECVFGEIIWRTFEFCGLKFEFWVSFREELAVLIKWVFHLSLHGIEVFPDQTLQVTTGDQLITIPTLASQQTPFKENMKSDPSVDNPQCFSFNFYISLNSEIMGSGVLKSIPDQWRYLFLGNALKIA